MGSRIPANGNSALETPGSRKETERFHATWEAGKIDRLIGWLSLPPLEIPGVSVGILERP